MDYQVCGCKSGLKMVGVPMSGVKSMTVLAMVGVGSRFEDKKVAGISHFLEHFVFQGTKKWPNATAIAKAIDGVGGEHNAFTGKDYTGYYIKLASDKLKLALDMVSDWLLEPILPAKELAKEKGVILEEISMYEDDPKRYVYDVFDRVIYGDSSLGREVIGVRKTVSDLKRSDLANHLTQWYGQGNVVIGVVGDASKLKVQSSPVPVGTGQAKLKNMVEEYFSKGLKRENNWPARRKLALGMEMQKEPRVRVVQKKTEGVHFHLGFPAYERKHKDKYVLRVLATILGGNSSARLFEEIRNKRGWAYYAYCNVDQYEETGAIYALLGVRPDKTEEAVKVVLNEFYKVGQTVTRDEVKRAKEYLKGKLALSLEDSEDLAQFYVRRMLLYGEIMTPEEMLAKVEAVKLEDVIRVAKDLLKPEKVNLAMIGPVKPAKIQAIV